MSISERQNELALKAEARKHKDESDDVLENVYEMLMQNVKAKKKY